MKSLPFRLTCFAYTILPLILVYASNGTVVLLAVIALAGLFAPEARKSTLFRLQTPPFLAALAFIIWAAITSLWAPNLLSGLHLGGRLLALLLAAAFASGQAATLPRPEHLTRILAFALPLTLGFYAADLATNGTLAEFIKHKEEASFIKLTRGSAVFLLCMPPTAAFLKRQPRGTLFSATFLLAAGVILYVLPNTAFFLAFIAAGLAFGLVHTARKAGLKILFGGYTLLALLMPFFSLSVQFLLDNFRFFRTLPLSWVHRLLIWQYTAEKIQKKPIFGYGLQASRHMGKDAPRLLLNPWAKPQDWVVEKVLPLHPHNGPLQILLENGTVGLFLFLVILWTLFRRIAALPEQTKPVAAASVTAFLVIFSISFGAFQNWWLAGAALAISLYALRPAAGEK